MGGSNCGSMLSGINSFDEQLVWIHEEFRDWRIRRSEGPQQVQSAASECILVWTWFQSLELERCLSSCRPVQRSLSSLVQNLSAVTGYLDPTPPTFETRFKGWLPVPEPTKYLKKVPML